MSDQGVRFIRKDGRVIPIHDGGNVGKSPHPLVKQARSKSGIISNHSPKGLKKVAAKTQAPKQVKVRAGYDALGVGLSVASGVIGAATFTGGAKRFASGFIASHVVDAAGLAANAASVAGSDNKTERAKKFAKQEVRNTVLGNAVYVAGLLALKQNRAAFRSGATTAVTLAKNIARLKFRA